MEEVSDEDHRQLFDINLWGVVYGSVTALRTLKQHSGALIKSGSVSSDFAFSDIEHVFGDQACVQA